MNKKALKAAVIITAAGSSQRMGSGEKKEFLEIDGQSVLFKAVKPFINTKFFTEYVIVLPKSEVEKGSKLLASVIPHGNFSFVSGGITRQESVYNGLLSLSEKKPDIVLIHDGARPWITESVIMEIYKKTVETGAAIPVVPSVNAMKTTNSNGIIVSHLERQFTVAAQTPQGFNFKQILFSHTSAKSDKLEYIDDAEIYGKYTGSVTAVPGDTTNRKITYLSDMST